MDQNAQTTQPVNPQMPTPPAPPTTPMDNVPNTSPPPRHIPKAAVVIIVVLILIVLSLGGFTAYKNLSSSNQVVTPTIVQNSPAPTMPKTIPKDLQTKPVIFIDVSFDIPSSWKYIEQTYPENTTFTADPNSICDPFCENRADPVFLLNQVRTTPLEGMVNRLTTAYQLTETTTTSVVIGRNIKATKLSGKFSPSTNVENRTYKQNAQLEFFIFSSPSSEVYYAHLSDSAYQNTFDQILSTFKFLDSNAPTCTPRPACLDSEPRCLIPETPDMCPPVTPLSVESGGNRVSWEQAVSHIQNCNVKEVLQSHALVIVLILKDGSQISATEPRIDEVFSVVNNAVPKCGQIGLSTE